MFSGCRVKQKCFRPLDPKLGHYLQKLQTSDDPKLKEKGEKKKLMVAKDLPRCQPVLTAIYKCMNQSFQNVQSTGKRTMLVVDMREKMLLHCWAGNKTISCLDAAVILIQTFVRVEREVTVGVFNGDSISIVPLDKSKFPERLRYERPTMLIFRIDCESNHSETERREKRASQSIIHVPLGDQ